MGKCHNAKKNGRTTRCIQKGGILSTLGILKRKKKKGLVPQKVPQDWEDMRVLLEELLEQQTEGEGVHRRHRDVKGAPVALRSKRVLCFRLYGEVPFLSPGILDMDHEA